MRRPGPAPAPAPAKLTEPLSLILSGPDLERLNEYREAVHLLTGEGWPEHAKAGNGPDNHRDKYESQRDRAMKALMGFLSDQADAQRSS